MNALGLNLPLALPSFFPDETLYCLASRFHVISGGRIPSTTCKLLFGHRYQGSQHDLPNRIGEFCSRTEGLLGDEKSIALTRTLVPFYLPLQSPIDAENAMQSMIGRQTGMLKFRLGILTSRFRANHPLKACPLCISEDQEAHGVAYWHLQHQYPGVWICTRHHALLEECTVKTNGIARFGWVLPSRDQLCAPSPPLNEKPPIDSLYRLAELILGWSNLPAGTHITTDSLARAYRTAMVDRWGSEPSSPVDRSTTAIDFCNTVAPLRIIPELRGLPSSFKEASQQLNRWVYSPRGGTHPLRHLAIIYWLFPNWDAFWQRYRDVETRQVDQSVGVAPRTQTADPRRQQLLTLLGNGKSVSHCASAVGVEVQTAMVWATNAGFKTSRRPKKFSDETLRNLIADLRNGIEKTEAAERYVVSVSTITRILLTEIGLQDSWHAARHEKARLHARGRWLAVLAEAPALGVKALRTMAPAAYAWLYRNDRDWLQEQNRASPKPRHDGSGNRVNWDARDRGLSDEVHRVSEQLFRETGRSTITLGQLCQRLPELKAKLGALHRLPMTLRVIEEVTKRRKKSVESILLL